MASADAPLVALDYQRSASLVESCPDESSFRNLVVARLGSDPFVTDGRAPDRVHVEVTLVHGRVMARAALLRQGQAPRAPRAIDGAPRECEAIVAALATTVAIALDPRSAAAPPASTEASAGSVEPGASGAAGAPEPPSGPTDRSEQAAQAPRASEPPLLFASAAPVLSVGVAPSPSVGGEAGIGLRRGHFSLALIARAESTPAATHVPSGDRIGAAIYSGSIAPCGNAAQARICGLFRVGAFEGDAPDLARKQPGALLYAALGLRLGYELPLSEAFALEPSLEVLVPLQRSSLVISGESVWTAPVASAGGAVTLLFSF